jgi:glucoamylase
VPQYATYTFTLYDLAGNQIGQPQTVLNIAANAPATAGVNVPWQTLGNDVIANLLTPGGSGTSVNGATNFTTSLDWTIPANTSGAVYPNLVAYINSLSKPTVVGTQTFPAQPNIMGYYSVTPVKTGTSSYSETSLSGFVDEITATTTPALDQAAQVQLVWQGGGTYGGGSYFSNTWQYNN